MKKLLLLLTVLIAINTNAQIPNNGFENWTAAGSYEDPTFWGSTNSSSSGPFYAVTKSTDHFPINMGNFSVRIENNTALSPDFSGRGFVATGPPPPSPNFSITGHPTSLTGYYNFAPQGGDTMLIQIQLYYNGISVADGDFATTASSSGWASFNIPISTYSIADSASIIMAAYNANGFNYLPHGNSVLYVDNLNFDVLLANLFEQSTSVSSFKLYPNPSSDVVTLSFDKIHKISRILTIYNVMGELILSEYLQDDKHQINTSELNNGIYTVVIESEERVEQQKFVIQK